MTLSVVPIAAKWALIGRWQPGSIRVWSPAYLRFWVVKTLVRASPMVLFAGTPAFTLYLRALGAKVGRDVVYLSSQVPVCTDLFSIGDGSLVRKESVVACYRAHDGRIEIGGVSIGAGAFVGEATVLDVRTAVGDGASLAHSSSLHAGQAIPAGEVWHGSPGRRADGPLPAVPPAPGSRSRRALYSTVLGVFVLAVASPAALVIAGALYSLVPQFAALLAPAPGALAIPGFHVDLLALSALLYFGALVLGLVVSTTVPRLFALGVRPDVVYPLYGVRYWLHRSIGALTNVKAFVELFGDSSAIAHYLALIGYRLRPIEQTGSNFGMAVAHENPFLTSVGRGTVVADGLSVMNAEYSATSFRVSHTAIGANNFLGNKIAYPPQGRTGDDCLLATKVAGPAARTRPEGGRPARLPELRDPADGRARQRPRRRRPAGAGRLAAPQEPPQRRLDGAAPARAVVLPLPDAREHRGGRLAADRRRGPARSSSPSWSASSCWSAASRWWSASSPR